MEQRLPFIATSHDDSYYMMLLGWMLSDIPAKVTHLEVKVVTLPLSAPLGHYLCFISVIQELLGIINNANLHRVARYQKDEKRGMSDDLGSRRAAIARASSDQCQLAIVDAAKVIQLLGRGLNPEVGGQHGQHRLWLDA